MVCVEIGRGSPSLTLGNRLPRTTMFCHPSILSRLTGELPLQEFGEGAHHRRHELSSRIGEARTRVGRPPLQQQRHQVAA